ncbi:hypothetical protein Zm00014a_037905 [Zea mays]|uniref:HAT transposon superfamily protein n=1 Tax=Zea mays TaxID=4577 RepID=A0A3L6DRB7_MAIZE|nr:hypothetical protein Zm00014a_037905 [Zea mays]
MATSSNASTEVSGSGGSFPVANNPAIAGQVLAAACMVPPDDDEKKPLWRYAEIIERTGKGLGENVRIRCRLCNHVWNGSYSRVKAHLLKIPGFVVKFCRVVTVHVLDQLKAEVAAASAVADRTMPRDIPLPVEGKEKKRRRGVSAIESSFNLDVRQAFMFAANNPIGGYVPPSYKLRTTILMQERTHVERMLQPVKETWSSKGWISEVIGDANMIKNFIMNHSMRLAMFNEQRNLKFLAIADTRFASAIVMLKRFIIIKDALSVMVVSEKWSTYREDNPRQAQFVKEKIVNDLWWDKVRYFLSFAEPVYTMIRAAGTDKPCLHLMYEMWDTMIEKVNSVIYRHEIKESHEESIFYSAVHDILVSRWRKSNTPLHCLAHSLNPKYYTDAWINEVLNGQAPHNDEEISEMRNACFRSYFSGEELKIKLQYANFSLFGTGFNSFDSIEDRGYMEPKLWWRIHGHSAPELKSGPSAMWDVGADTFEADFEGGAGFLEQADLSLDEPELEEKLFEDLGALDLAKDAEPNEE